MTLRDRLSPTRLLSWRRRKDAPDKPVPAHMQPWHPLFRKAVAIHIRETTQ